MSVAITQAEIDALHKLLDSIRDQNPVQVAALRALVERAQPDDGPTVEDLPAQWEAWARRDPQSWQQKEMSSWDCGFVAGIEGCAWELRRAFARRNK